MATCTLQPDDIIVFGCGEWTFHSDWTPEWESREMVVVCMYSTEWRELIDGETPESLGLC